MILSFFGAKIDDFSDFLKITQIQTGNRPFNRELNLCCKTVKWEVVLKEKEPVCKFEKIHL